MKFNKNIIIKSFGAAAIVMTGLGAVSCGDMLDLKPQGVLFADQIGEDQAIELMTAAYACLVNNLDPGNNDQSFNGPINNWVIDLRSDDALKGGPDAGNQGHMLQLEIGNIQSDNGSINQKWANDYFSVARCNTAIQTLLSSDGIAPEVRNAYVAEMKVLRAYFYFDILRLFKKFPYIDETMDASTVPAGNKTRQEVAELIKEDLRNGYELLPATQELVGRFNKYVAAALLARVDLFTATPEFTTNPQAAWAEAEKYCDYVITSGQYDLYDHFQDISNPQMNNGVESVMAIQFSSANEGQMYDFNNCLNCTVSVGNVYGNGDDFYLGSQDLANAFRTNENGLPYLDGYTGNDIVNRVDEEGLNDPNVYKGNVDPRLDLTMGRIGVYWRSNLGVPAQTYMYTQGWCRNYDLFGQFSGKKPYPAPYDPAVTIGIVPWGASTLNFMIIRYADVLLMKAEAMIEQNNPDYQTAISYINQVRRRAQMSFDMNYEGPTDLNPNVVNYKVEEYPLTGWNQENARQAVRYERRLEFALEGLRWFDLLRWGVAQEVMTKYYQYESQFQEYYNSASLNPNDYYFPIPLNQVDTSNGLYSN
ncbi:MAG: RagB/SusD family nutrient uptake outer membrane protein [Muribaculaceae bacterium]|nr:RagB/SusD family nutrient uptake outer membrane protein [Muribaculaceae bacterium]